MTMRHSTQPLRLGLGPLRSLSALLVGAASLTALPACDAAPTRGCPGTEIFIDGECVQPHMIRLNSVGYLPTRAKLASYVGDETSFQVMTREGRVVFEGSATTEVSARDSGERVRIADFSELEEPGEYWLEVPGVGRSPDFRIGDDVFHEPLVASLLALHGQRCGTAVELEWGEGTFKHAACHLEEAGLDYIDGEQGTKDATGGWHDAGDYGKYTVNGAFAVAFLLQAYEDFPDRLKDLELPIPERGGELPDILDEARFQLEWLLKMQLADGSVAHKVTAKNFEGNIMPEADHAPRFFVPAGTAATGTFAATLALAARVYEPFDPDFAATCLEAAQQAFDFLLENREDITPNQSDFRTGGYEAPGYDDERAWAAAELWETTGDPAALEEFELLARELGMSMLLNFDWSNSTNLALATYLRSKREGRDLDLVESIRATTLSTAQSLVENWKSHGYGRSVGSIYYWGINGVIARTAFNLVAAHRLDPDPTYLDAITGQLDHLFGRNPYGRSYLTGVGYRPPQFPHHRPSMASGGRFPWPGLLIGGPHSELFSDPAANVPEGLTWEDRAENYIHNEIAINWNTALVYALVAAE